MTSHSFFFLLFLLLLFLLFFVFSLSSSSLPPWQPATHFFFFFFFFFLLLLLPLLFLLLLLFFGLLPWRQVTFSSFSSLSSSSFFLFFFSTSPQQAAGVCWKASNSESRCRQQQASPLLLFFSSSSFSSQPASHSSFSLLLLLFLLSQRRLVRTRGKAAMELKQLPMAEGWSSRGYEGGDNLKRRQAIGHLLLSPLSASLAGRNVLPSSRCSPLQVDFLLLDAVEDPGCWKGWRQWELGGAAIIFCDMSRRKMGIDVMLDEKDGMGDDEGGREEEGRHHLDVPLLFLFWRAPALSHGLLGGDGGGSCLR